VHHITRCYSKAGARARFVDVDIPAWTSTPGDPPSEEILLLKILILEILLLEILS